MKSGKKMLGVIIVSLLLIGSISLVSAELKDWFVFGEAEENLEGELPASFNIGIQMTNQAPTIDSWTVPTASPNGDCSATTLGNFVVTVSDPDGGADLSDGTVTLQLSNTHATLGAQVRPAVAVTCSAGTPSGNTLAFTCSGISMNYWDDGGAGDLWTVTVTATDGATAATNSPKTSDGTGNYPYFLYGSSKLLQTKDSNDPADYTGGDDTITWSAIQTTSSDEASTIYLTSRNCGNEAVPSTSITGEKLDSATTSTDICPDSFSVRAAAVPCNFGDFLNWPASAQIITSSAISRSTGAEENADFYFCLENINPTPDVPATCLEPIEVGTYNSVGNQWTITFN
jgi:hypothetical protein